MNYLSANLGASITTQAALEPGNSVDALLTDDPLGSGNFSFAKVKQAQVFVVDLGQDREFDRMQIGSVGVGGDRSAKRLKIEVSSTGADGPYKTILDRGELGYLQVVRLPLVKARWIRFDLGEGEDGAMVRVVRIYKGYEHPKLAEVTRLLYERIKPDVKGLEKFYAASEAGDWVKACAELRAYYSITQRPDAPPDPGYDLTRAKDLEAGRIEQAGIARQEKLPIDWSYQKTTDWYEHKNFLNRGTALGVPVDAYYHTGDEKWARLAREVIYDWIDANPVPEVLGKRDYPTWRTLDSALRDAWLTTRFSKLTAAKGIDDEVWANWLYLIWQHADYLRKDDFDGGNWQAMVTVDVMRVALQFPEFKDQSQWLVYGAGAFERNVLLNVYADGKEDEDAVGYVGMANAGMFGALMSLEKAGVVIKPEVKERLSKTPLFLASVFQPNGNEPAIGDADRGPMGYDLSQQVDYFKLEDVRYILSKGKEGTLPAFSSINFPVGLWTVMRSPYDERPWEDARHLIFKASCGSHGHPDVLQITAYAYGRELIIDPGIASYEGEDVERFLQTSYHNTICVDNKNLSRSDGKIEKWFTNAGIDYVYGTHHGYKLLDERRSVFFVRPDYWVIHDEIVGEGSHTYDQNWHMHADAGLVEDPVTKTVRTSFATGGNLAMVPADVTALKSESFDYLIAGAKAVGRPNTPSKGWRYSKSGPAPQTFDLVLYPYREGTSPSISAEVLALDGLSSLDATALRVTVGDAVDYVVSSRTGARTMSAPDAGLTVDGEICVVRTKGGKPVRVSGTNLKSVTLGGKTIFSAQQLSTDVDQVIQAE